MGSGKDTVAALINQFTRNGYEVKRFAGKLKLVASILTGIPVESFEDQAFKKTFLPNCWDKLRLAPTTAGTPVQPKYGGTVVQQHMTVRELLQKLGTDAIRNYLHEDAWVNALFADYTDRSFWIIPDTRFMNEYMSIKNHGGIVIRVNRKNTIENAHPSETALDHVAFDYVIDNNSTLDDLKKQVRQLLEIL
jgi:hypothetical protein